MTRASYFAVDRRAWCAACDLGMNEAVSYLVIAAGTGADQRTSGWSATAIEKYTGIHHRRAAAAIARLQDIGLVTVEKLGKLRRYFLVPVDQVASIVASTAAKTRDKSACQAALDRLANPEWIWLPNALVEGAGTETPPVKLLRQSQDLDALRLFIDLYYNHDLPGSGGVEWRKAIGIRQLYERKLVGEHGIYKVWGFQPSKMETYKSASFWFDEFWNAWGILKDAGLVEFVAHLVESDGEDAEIVHPLPWGNGEAAEIEITIAADEAGRRMVPFFTDNTTLLIPVSKLRPKIQLIGVVRMKYRPQTARTAEWLSNVDEWKKTAMAFEELARSITDSGIKVVSR
ncbi:hypothetical protein [Sinorhizobium meliloti]|uniref:hypothetical protein n=1 Tax=Rhizobium meliloti TaxID=382 RepID=UPI000FDA263B|nr:hypothetical protein [Sinorhizobium meliloti]RVL05657.1 hypothetical protein CN152_03385 [Sinorhizobium meliloti]RVN49961.1 hypothetical protein CN113_06970 [Sinorhizobium meliloti]